MNTLATLLTAFKTIPASERKNPARRQELLSVVQAVIGKQEDLVSTRVYLMPGDTLQFVLNFKPSWLADTEHEASIDFQVDRKEYRVRGVIVDNADSPLTEWGDTEREDCEFDIKKFADYATPIFFILCNLREMYRRKFNSILKNTDPDLAHAVEVSSLIKTHVNAIKELCAKNCVNLWIDTNLDSTPTVYVLPQNASTDSDIYQPDAVIKEDKVPCFDLGFHSFNSDYDRFIYPEKNKKL